jgi:hypothetical protein
MMTSLYQAEKSSERVVRALSLAMDKYQVIDD